MQTKITIRNEAQRCYIDIEGTIGVPEEHQFEDASSRVATFESFRREVKRIAEVAAKSVVVNIRSTGGDVNDALLIYDALRALDADITTRCYGYTASAATIIAQAADEGGREISSNALYLIHNATCSIDGNSSSLDARAELLRKTDEQLARLYALHSGREAEFFAALMAENNGEGRWLTAEEAIEAGLADRLIDFEEEGQEPTPKKELETEEPKESEGDEPSEEPKSLPSDKATIEVKPTPKPKTKPHEAKQASAETAWGSIIRYLLNRLAVRIDEWIDSLREKRQEKQQNEKEQTKTEEQGGKKGRGSRSARRRKGEQEQSAQGDKSNLQPETETPAAETPATEPSATETPSIEQRAQSSATMPKASADSSVMQFVERQRCFIASRLQAVEDPSMRGASHYANEKAYADDVRAFER